MSDQKPEDKVQPSGNAPRPLTEQEAERMAEITPSDIARSMANAQKHSPQLAAFLRAKKVR